MRVLSLILFISTNFAPFECFGLLETFPNKTCSGKSPELGFVKGRGNFVFQCVKSAKSRSYRREPVGYLYGTRLLKNGDTIEVRPDPESNISFILFCKITKKSMSLRTSVCKFLIDSDTFATLPVGKNGTIGQTLCTCKDVKNSRTVATCEGPDVKLKSTTITPTMN